MYQSYSSSELKTANYPVGNYQSNSPSMGSSYSVQNQTYTRNTGSNGLTAGGSSIFIGSRGSGGSASSMSTGNNMTSDVTTLSTDINMSTSSTRQSVGAGSSTAATDPGGDPDSGTAIPVPDGLGFLLLLAAIYAFVKTKYFATIKNLFFLK